jgi:hypothetical protein
MLSHEWQELEQLSEQITVMRERCEAARRSHHVGQQDALKHDIADAVRRRESLIAHISARFGSLAA